MLFTLAANGAFADATVTKDEFLKSDWRTIGRKLDDELAGHASRSKVRLGNLLGYEVIVYNGSETVAPMFLVAAGMDLDFTSIRVKLAYSYTVI